MEKFMPSQLNCMNVRVGFLQSAKKDACILRKISLNYNLNSSLNS